MPSALETLVKILKLERDQGGKNTAVVGGLSAYAAGWQPQAREQARRARHHILIDEIVDALTEYDRIASEDERIDRINYLLNRVTDRQKAPPAYQKRLSEWEKKLGSRKERPPTPKRGRSSHEHVDRRTARQQRGGQGRRFHAYDSASYDEDFTRGPSQSALDIPPLPSLNRPPRQPRPALSLEEQLALYRELEAPVTELKGIGNTYSEMLRQLDIHNVRDLLYFFPRDFVDYTRLTCIKDLAAGQTANVIATVERASTAVAAGGRMDLIVSVSDHTARMSVRFFSQPFLSQKIKRGMHLLLRGKVSDFLSMANPEWEELDLDNLRNIGIVPVYRLTKGLRPRMLRRTMKVLTSEWENKIPDPIPVSVLERGDLADLGWALKQAHFPDGDDHRCHAQRRLAFDHLLMLQLALLSRRRQWQSAPGTPLMEDEDVLRRFAAEVFPFEMTAGQKKALQEIQQDLSRSTPMNRLIQGDVGSGKTAVAILAMAIAFSNHKQSALMAPTGILAEQHYRSLRATFAKMSGPDKPVIALLTSALTAEEREAVYRDIAAGEVDMVVGTHALIQQGVEFSDLALAVIDEQQRFGVAQRSQLRGKGGNPHLLIMTATPLPRTLALTYYADLDVSVIADKPAGRREIQTKVIDPAARERLNGFVISQLEQGRQAFFVHPLVEKSESLETASAKEAYELLSQVYYQYRVCLLHGRMNAAEKDALMAEFAAGEYDVMVTTSMAEVGVDVPNASVIVIDGANRFGLTQLHQLRGRVGRNEEQSYCFLLPDSAVDISIDRIRACQAGDLDRKALTIAEQRLSAMEQSNDGFALAERDWQLRGAGELLGTRQSGHLDFDMLDPGNAELIKEARFEARTLVEEDPDIKLPEHQLLAAFVSQLYPAKSEMS